MARLECYRCHKTVSSELPEAAVVRAVLFCPECIEEMASLLPDWERVLEKD